MFFEGAQYNIYEIPLLIITIIYIIYAISNYIYWEKMKTQIYFLIMIYVFFGFLIILYIYMILMGKFR